MLKSRVLIQFKKHIIDIIFIIALTLYGLKLTYGIESFIDIELFDETIYLSKGLQLPSQGLPSSAYAPLYAIWYYFLSHFADRATDLFYLNYKLLIIFPVILLYLYQRTLAIPNFLALGSAFLFLNSKFISINPKPTHFALLVLLTFLILMRIIPSKPSWRYVILAVAFLFLSFIRPEYFLSFLLVISYYSYQQLKRIKGNINFSLIVRNSYKEVIALILISGLLITIFGLPIATNNNETSRTWIAFCQHFGYLWLIRNPNVNLNAYTDCDTIISMVFGSSQSFTAAIAANPQEFLTHILINFLSYFDHFITVLLVDFQDYGATFNRSVRYTEFVLLLVVLGFIVIKSKLQKYALVANFDETIKVAYLVTIIPTLIVSILINPRFHYLIIQSALAFVVITYSFAQIISNERFKLRSIVPLKVTVIFTTIALFFFTPNLAHGWCILPNECLVERYINVSHNPLKTASTIAFIQSLNLSANQPTNFLEAEGGIAVYLSNNYQYIAHYEKQQNFQSFVQNNNINMILITENLLKDTRYRDDREFKEVRQQPQQFGFKALTIPQTQATLLVSENLFLPNPVKP